MGITDEDLDEWERLDKAATPGPWQVKEEKIPANKTAETAGILAPAKTELTIHTAWGHSQLGGSPAPIVTTSHTPFFGDRTVYIHISEADAALIAAARAALPTLIAEVRRLRERADDAYQDRLERDLLDA